MWIDENDDRKKLSAEILGLTGISVAVGIFFYIFLKATSKSIVLMYCDTHQIMMQEDQIWALESGIQSICFVAAVLLFIFLFLFLVGRKLAYLKDIMEGIEALKNHKEGHEIPLEGNNELTDLARSINYFAKAEQELKEKEIQMQEDKEHLIRTLSHDIRTPLTAISSYSEYLKEKESLTQEEIKEYINLMLQKARQIKVLSDQLLNGNSRDTEFIEDGRLFMVQLIDQWETLLEGRFTCFADLSGCPAFSGRIDIHKMQRIFDNLASNIEKYADPRDGIDLIVGVENNRLQLTQGNRCLQKPKWVPSSKIGLSSIRSIAAEYGGSVEVMKEEDYFSIRITLMEIL